MSDNPYASPAVTPSVATLGDRPLRCPECNEEMEQGYITTTGRMYWRTWDDQSWILTEQQHGVSGTNPGFFSANRLSGYRCSGCELVIFRHGTQKKSYAPEDDPQS